MNRIRLTKTSPRSALLIIAVAALALFPITPLSSTAGESKAQDNMQGMAGMDMGNQKGAQPPTMVDALKAERIGLKLATVEEQDLVKTIRAMGRVAYDERRLAQIHLRVEGWIEDLFVNFTGQAVKKGDPLFSVYAPDFLSTQQEYLLALKSQAKLQASPVAEVRQTGNLLVEAAKKRLRLWNISERQIQDLEERGKADTVMTVYAPINGVVIKRRGTQGMRITPEMALYEIADLSKVWVFAEVYESEMGTLSPGQDAEIHVSALPGERFTAKIAFIDPVLNPETRTVRVRLDLPNSDLRLKPEMFAEVLFNAPIGRALVIPESAVLDSGLRRIVFVDRGMGMYDARNVEVSRNGETYIVLSGLKAGERVVSAGNFLIDSESKLMASANMMGALGMGGIKMEQAQMGEMDMGGMKEMKGMSEIKTATVQSLTVEGMTWTLSTEPSPPQEGENRLKLKIADSSGKGVENAKVVFAYTMPMPGMRVTKRPAEFRDGHYEAAVNFGMAGSWEVTAHVRLPGKPERSEKFVLEAGGEMDMDDMKGMPGM